jgi:3-phosphoshikimate 1-carboxyvinyltransferase
VVQAHSLQIRPVELFSGAVRVPGDKSVSHRYVMLGGIARGVTSITGLAPGADVAATINVFRALGLTIEETGMGAVRVHGRGWAGLRTPAGALDACNSGTTLRLMTGLLAGRPLQVSFTGDDSLRRRPMGRVVTPLAAMGARIETTDGRAPITIDGTDLTGIEWTPPVPSAQVKSALMLAGLSARGTTTIIETLPTRDHSERAFPLFGLRADVTGHHITVPGGQEATAPSDRLEVPGDPSSAAVWAAAAAAIPGGWVRIERVLLNPRRLGFVQALRQMGADILMTASDEHGSELVGTLEIRHRAHGPCVIDERAVPDLIDELPVLAARAALGGRLDVRGAAELRVKESDRITALVNGFRQLGVSAEERPDGFVIDGARRPTGGDVDACGDHRLVMAFALVGLGATGTTTIRGAEAVAVSYPDFARDLASLTGITP